MGVDATNAGERLHIGTCRNELDVEMSAAPASPQTLMEVLRPDICQAAVAAH